MVKKKKSLLRKNSPKAQVVKRNKFLRSQGSELPSRGQTEVAEAVIDPVAADDAQAIRIEVADEDPVAVRIDIQTANVDPFEEPLTGGQKVADDGVDHHPGSRRLLVLSKKSLLLVPGLAGRIVDRGLANQVPLRFSAILGEGLPVIPVLIVEQALVAGNLAVDLENRERKDGDEDVRVLALLECRLGERNFGKSGELLLRGIDPEVLDCFLDAEVVAAHDLAAALLACRRLEASVLDQPHHFRGKIVAL